MDAYVTQSLAAFRLIIAIGLVSAIGGAGLLARTEIPLWRGFAIALIAGGLFEACASGWLVLRSGDKFAEMHRLMATGELEARLLKAVAGYQSSFTVQAALAAGALLVLFVSDKLFVRGLAIGLLVHLVIIAGLDWSGMSREQALLATNSED